MDIPAFLSLMLFSIVISATPGPNNLLLATSGLTYGFRKTVPAIFGVQIGIVSLLLLCGAGLGTLVTSYPSLQSGLKIAGTLYLAYLAWRLWSAGGELSSIEERPPLKVWHAAAFQLLNPKAWMMAVSAVSVYVAPAERYFPALVIVVVTFSALSTPSVTLWAAFGAGLKNALNDPKRIRLFNRIMAALTALSGALILFWS